MYIEYLHLMVRIVQVGHNELVIDHECERNHIILLWNELLPVCTIWLFDIDGDDAASRRIQVSLKIKEGAGVADKVVAGIGFIQQANKWVLALNFAIVDAILRLGAMPDVQHQVGSIVGDKR